MTTRTTVFCSSCGMENPIAGRFCSTCGVALGTVGGTPVPLAGAAPPPVGVTTVTEGLVGTLVQRIAMPSVSLLGLAALVATVMGMGATSGWVWATRRTGALIEVAHPALGYGIGAVLAIILAAAFFRILNPKPRDVGMKAARRYRRTLRERDGIRLLLRPGGVRSGVVVMTLLWLGLIGLAWMNLSDLRDEGATIEFGMWLAILIPAVGLVPTIAMWPFRAERVFMDRQGNITRG